MRRLTWLALFLAVAGARLWLVDRFSTALPLWDQWDAEGTALLKPWIEGRLDPHVFLAAHNEHRIALTRLLALALFAVNGQWDGLLEMTVNALLCGGFAVALARMFRGWTALWALGVCWILPFGWENTLCGFQSQNYFLVFFSLGAIWGLETGRPFRARWWLGVGSLGLACLSMATGFIAAAAVLGMRVLRLVAARRLPSRGETGTLTLCLGVVALGWGTRVVIPAHAALGAESAGAFFWAFARFAAWPWCEHPLGAAMIYLPWAALLWRDLRGGRSGLLLTAGAWTLLQTAALALGRGGQGVPPACRYMDLLAVAPLVGALCWRELWPQARWRPVAGCWMLLLAAGLAQETARDFRDWLPESRRGKERAAENVRGYLRTGDFARFLADKERADLPFPDPQRLRVFLDDPTLRGALPADVREPLAVTGVTLSGSTFTGEREGAPYWGIKGAGAIQARVKPGAGLPYARFAFAGDLGAKGGPSFRVQGVDWAPERPAGERWHVDFLRTGGKGFTVEATNAASGRWMAFTAPAEVGRWSYWAGFGARRGGWLFLAGLGLGVCGWIFGAVRFKGRLAKEEG